MLLGDRGASWGFHIGNRFYILFFVEPTDSTGLQVATKCCAYLRTISLLQTSKAYDINIAIERFASRIETS
jgi:hypothetical protein